MAESQANDIDPIEDYDEYWELHRIFKGTNEEGTHAEFFSRTATEVEADLSKWLTGDANRMKHHGSFLMVAPFDHVIKKGKNQYHVIVGPNIDYDGTHHKPEDIEDGDSMKTFYDAMAFAAVLMSTHGRVWTNSIWQTVGDTDPTAYPFMCEQEWRSPVLCIFQAEGHKFAFGFCQDQPNEYNTHKEGCKHDKSLGGARKNWRKQRARNVNFCYADEMKMLINGNLPGFNISFKKDMHKNFTQLEELSGPNLEEWVKDYVSKLDH